MNSTQKQIAEKIINSKIPFTAREELVIKWRLAGKTRKEIGAKYYQEVGGNPVTQERIRQVEEKALRKIRTFFI